VIALAVTAPWIVHWMLVEALDTGRTGPPPPSSAYRPWFARLGEGRSLPVRVLLLPLVPFGKLLGVLSRHWLPELELLERERPLMLGMAVGMLGLFLVPGVNFFFRPAMVVAATNVRGRLELEG
jgi:hypothetical protein